MNGLESAMATTDEETLHEFAAVLQLSLGGRPAEHEIKTAMIAIATAAIR